jgi:hypothetical protein
MTSNCQHDLNQGTTCPCLYLLSHLRIRSLNRNVVELTYCQLLDSHGYHMVSRGKHFVVSIFKLCLLQLEGDTNLNFVFSEGTAAALAVPLARGSSKS